MINLFSNYKIKSHIIKNRVVLPPVVNFGWADENGFVNEKHVKHYEERAAGWASEGSFSQADYLQKEADYYHQKAAENLNQ